MCYDADRRIGTIIGIFPGAGATIAAFISYDMAKKASRTPEKFGKGSLEGVAAAEGANSSSVGGALVPLLALGIPGSATDAVLLGAFMLHDLVPGPLLFQEHPDIVYGIFCALILANIIMLVIVMLVHVFLSYTKHGRYLYIVGGNREAARLSGIPVNRYRTLAYFISTLLAGFGGIMLAARIGSAQINAGAGYLMPAVAAAFIGFSVAGVKKPNAIGTLVGAILVGVLENGLIMMSVPYYSLNIIKGLVLAIALAITYYKKHD